MKARKTLACCLLAAVMVIMCATPAFAGQWRQGTYGRWWFENSDGSYPASGMYKIAEHYFIFDANGYLLESQWTRLSDGRWYYCLPGGYVAQNRWVGDYYLGSDCAMVTNTWVGDYFVDSTGKWDPSKKKSS